MNTSHVTQYTLEEVAAQWKVSVSTLRRAINAGSLGHHRIGKRGQIRLEEAHLREWMQAGSEKDRSSTGIPSSNPNGRTAGGPKSTTTVNVGEKLKLTLVNADVRVGLASLTSGSANAIVTSPPYFWQRDYNVEGQIGHEPTIQGYVDALVQTFREARRVLADDGLLFLNLGDAYYNAKGRPHGKDPKHGARQMAREKLRAVDGPGLGLPRKSLIGLPWRVALAIQADGWTLRSPVIWHRPSSLGEPTSHDRPWRTYEHLFIFSKGPKYFFDRAGLNGEEDIWTIKARPENPYAHCAPFPLALVEKCLNVGCKPGGVVLDPFMGSGTTAIAALKSGRSAVGVELNAEYCELSRIRVLKALDQELTEPETRRAKEAGRKKYAPDSSAIFKGIQLATT